MNGHFFEMVRLCWEKYPFGDGECVVNGMLPVQYMWYKMGKLRPKIIVWVHYSMIYSWLQSSIGESQQWNIWRAFRALNNTMD